MTTDAVTPLLMPALSDYPADTDVHAADLSSRVIAWLDAHLAELSDRSAIAVHLDSLGALPAVGDPIEAALAAFAALAARLTEVGDPGRAGLVLPLHSVAPGLAAAPLTRAALAAQLHPVEPPSLCVVAWRGLGRRGARDEHRALLPFAVSPPDGARPAGCAVRVYYREHPRERAVHIDAYPPTHA